MTEAATAAQRRKRSRSPSLFPAQGCGDADPDRSLRRQAEGAGRQAPRQGGVHAGQICFSRRPRRQVRQPRSRRRSDYRASSRPTCSRAARRSRRRARVRSRSPRSARPARKPGSASAARSTSRSKLEGAWKPFTEAGLLPDPSSLFLIARAITPPGRVRRFDTRFFTADASSHRPSRRRRDPCRCRTGRTGVGRDRLAAARRRACHDQERARRTRPPPRHRPACATTRRCRSSISTAARCRRTCWGRKASALSPSFRGSEAIEPGICESPGCALPLIWSSDHPGMTVVSNSPHKSKIIFSRRSNGAALIASLSLPQQ